jgi:hypothetical protein
VQQLRKGLELAMQRSNYITTLSTLRHGTRCWLIVSGLILVIKLDDLYNRNEAKLMLLDSIRFFFRPRVTMASQGIYT